ncbi:MAG: YbaK/EbsC family protein [Christensenellales bacterium]|jgi:prolyl-tRNA editing enzyme YbaK/EbsC (Cys-tRNA(Pro) deacylase)
MFDLAKAHLTALGLEDRIQVFEVSSETVALAAQAVGCPEAQIAKTLSFLVDGKAVLVVAAGDARIDNKKFKAQFHQKAVMLSPDQVIDLVGHAVGGVCPFGVKPGVEVYLDESLRRFEWVYPACGSGNSAVKLSPRELEMASGANEWVDVCRY